MPENPVAIARELGETVGRLRFGGEVGHVYNPLDYAWPLHELYLRRYGSGRKRVLFLGMNPGPWGMVQTGVPFGEVTMVRDWMGLDAPVRRPSKEHPKRPVTGLACHRSEVSGRRLWGLFAERFPDPRDFFAEHLVLNWCPLAFMAETGRNITPDKLERRCRERLTRICDEHLCRLVEAYRPQWVVGVGGFAVKRAISTCDGMDLRIGTVLHPSPASPAANRGWAEAATRQLQEQDIW